MNDATYFELVVVCEARSNDLFLEAGDGIAGLANFLDLLTGSGKTNTLVAQGQSPVHEVMRSNLGWGENSPYLGFFFSYSTRLTRRET